MKELLKDCNDLPLPDPDFDQKQARSILKYLRSVTK